MCKVCKFNNVCWVNSDGVSLTETGSWNLSITCVHDVFHDVLPLRSHSHRDKFLTPTLTRRCRRKVRAGSSNKQTTNTNTDTMYCTPCPLQEHVAVCWDSDNLRRLLGSAWREACQRGCWGEDSHNAERENETIAQSLMNSSGRPTFGPQKRPAPPVYVNGAPLHAPANQEEASQEKAKRRQRSDTGQAQDNKPIHAYGTTQWTHSTHNSHPIP